MKLIDATKLQELIISHPELTKERRELIVDFLLDLNTAEVKELVDSWDPSERAFVVGCLDLDATPSAMPTLSPSEQPLIPKSL